MESEGWMDGKQLGLSNLAALVSLSYLRNFKWILIIESVEKKKESHLIVSVGKCTLSSKIQSVHGEMTVLLMKRTSQNRLSVIIQSVFNLYSTA